MRRISESSLGRIFPRLLTALVLLVALGLVGVAAAPVHASGGGSGSGSGSGGGKDFSLCCTSTNPGFVIRGGLASCNICDPGSNWEPRYFSCGFSSCGYNGSWVVLQSLNGFEGTVTLEVLGLPPGVTSQTATSVFVRKDNQAITPFKLQAASGAALGDVTVSVRATSGGIVHANSELIRIADELPPNGP